MPSLFYLNKINKFVKKTRQKAITNITPLTGSNVSRVSSKAMATANPAIINIIADVIESISGPVDEVLDSIQSFFYYPVTDWMRVFGLFFPKPPFFARAGCEFGCASKPICES
jgi:hypothetical protein